MIEHDLNEFAGFNWGEYKTTMAESSSSGNGTPLLNSSVEVYNFDEITKDLFGKTGNRPSSADCIFIHDNDIDVMEFKAGFHSAEVVRKMDKRDGECPNCEAYKQKELRARVLIKAIESYITLNKQIFPKCKHLKDKVFNLNYKLIIDGEPLEDMMGIFANLTKGKKCRLNEADKPLVKELKQVLNGLVGYKEVNGDKYYYDTAMVHVNYQYKRNFLGK